MPRVKLDLTLSWDNLYVSSLYSGDQELELIDASENDLALELNSGNLPYSWKSILSQFPEKFSLHIEAEPVSNFQKSQFFGLWKGDIDASYDAWLSHTHEEWIQNLREKHPDAKGFPNKFDIEHLLFSAKILMSHMDIEEIHSVLYSVTHDSCWSWKQHLLSKLHPSQLKHLK